MSDGKAKLEWHVKPRDSGSARIQLDPGKVVDGIAAQRDQVSNLFEAALAGSYFERRPRRETECADTHDVGEKEILEFPVVRNVKENFSGRPSLFWHAFVSLDEFGACWGTRSSRNAKPTS